MSDDQCTEVGGPNGEPLRRCRLTAGHGGGHSDGSLTWLLGLEPTVTPLQERGPEQPTQWCGDGGARVGGPCSMTLGHEGSHQNGRHTWRHAQENYRSTNLAGAKHDDLIRDLFRRVEQLEQTSASGAATDDMFAAQARKHSHLAQTVGELSKRMTRLEQAQVYGPGPHDLSVLQASIANHVNQALTEFGSQLGILLDGMQGMLAQHISTNTAAVLARLEPAEPVPLPVVCEAPDNTGTLHCEKGPGHGGRHQSGNTSWPNPCKQPHPTLGVTCCTVKGHTTEHLAAYDTRYGRVRWVDGQEQYQDLGTVRDDGAQNERASASPAAVRCPAQFREGQCLGYAGHEGECSALPDPREPQLENQEEFDHTSYASLDYLNRRGVPDEPGDPFEGDGHGDTSHSV